MRLMMLVVIGSAIRKIHIILFSSGTSIPTRKEILKGINAVN